MEDYAPGSGLLPAILLSRALERRHRGEWLVPSGHTVQVPALYLYTLRPVGPAALCPDPWSRKARAHVRGDYPPARPRGPAPAYKGTLLSTYQRRFWFGRRVQGGEKARLT